MNSGDTIYALATVPGKAGVAVVRVSGPDARTSVERLSKPLRKPRFMSLRKLRDGERVLDEALVVWFPEGKSFTGEDVVELHLHGSRAVVKSVLGVLGEFPGLRPAEPGEFTKRALENGRLDLAQVEGLADLIDAQTEAQRVLAINLVEGRFSEEIAALRSELLGVLSLIEASIDFSDEDDAPVDVEPEIGASLQTISERLAGITQGSDEAASVREGFRVALIGAPNVGKSSLINAIAGREVAITSEIEGTTRDVIEVNCDLSGLPVTFVDTAGLRETSDQVESIGVERASRAAHEADLVLLLETEDASFPRDFDVRRDGDLRVWTKSDVYPSSDDLSVSARSGEGMGKLLQKVHEVLEETAAGAGMVAKDRQVRRLRLAGARISDARECDGLEVAAFEIRAALRELDEIVGIVDTEMVLGEIFSRFCMGK